MFPWLNEDFTLTNPVLPSLPETKLFLSGNPLFPAIAIPAILSLASWLDTAEVLTDDFPSRFWHCCTIFPFVSCGRDSVISIELVSIPKNCIF